MLGMRLPLKDAVRIVFLRLVTEDEHRFIGHIDASIIVVVVSRRGNPIAGEHERRRQGRLACRPTLSTAGE